MRYIKARKETAAYLGLLGSRNIFPDGNYLLWDRDVARLEGSGGLGELLPQIGAVELTAQEVRAEQEGTGEARELPEVTLAVILESAAALRGDDDRIADAGSSEGRRS